MPRTAATGSQQRQHSEFIVSWGDPAGDVVGAHPHCIAERSSDNSGPAGPDSERCFYEGSSVWGDRVSGAWYEGMRLGDE